MNGGEGKSTVGRSGQGGDRQAHQSLFIGLASLIEDASVPYVAAVFGIIFESVQLLSLAFNPLYEYKLTGVREAGYFAWAFQLPLWDGRSMGRMDLAVAFTCLVLLFLAAFLAIVIAIGVINRSVERHGAVSSFGAYMLQAFGSWLMIPSLHFALAPLFCDGDRMYWYPEEQCWSGLHVTSFVLGIVCTFVFATVSFCSATFLIRVNNAVTAGQNVDGASVLDRAHPYVDVVLAVSKITLVLAFHIFVALGGSRTAFSITLLVYCILAASLNTFFMPHHMDGVTRFKGAFFVATGWAAALNICIVGADSVLARRNVHTLIFAATLPLVLYIGNAIATYRISDETLHKITILREKGIVPIHEARFPFPEKLLENDLARLPPKFRGFENDLLAAEAPREDLEDRIDYFADLLEQPLLPEQAKDVAELLCPWIESARVATDAELANRTMRVLATITETAATEAAVAFAFRIYTKTLLLSRQASITITHLAAFVFHFAPKQQFVLQLLDSVDARSGESDLWVLFMSMRLGVEVKRHFGLRDAARVETFMSAKKLHKASLQSIAAFWSRLTSGSVDLTGIIHITNSLTSQRTKAFETYQRALASYGTDRQLLVLFAAFLGDVMLEPRAAMTVKNFADDLAEERRSTLLKGGSKGGGAAQELPEALNFNGGDSATVAPSSAASGADKGHGGGSAGGSGGGSFGRRGLTPTIVVMLVGIVLAVLCGSGIFGIAVVQVQQDALALEAISSLGIALESAASFATELDEMAHGEANSFALQETAAATTTVTDASDATASTALNTELTHVASAEVEFSARMNRFAEESTGYRGTLDSDAEWLLFGENSVAFDPSGSSGAWTKMSFLGLFELATIFRASVTTIVNKLARGLDATHFATLIDDNFGTFEVVVKKVADDIISNTLTTNQNRRTIAVALFCIAIFALCLAYSALHANLVNGGNMKATVIQLFSLIPLATQQALESDSRRRIEQFDQWEADDEQVGDKSSHDGDGAALEDESAGRSRSLGKESGAAAGGRPVSAGSRRHSSGARASEDLDGFRKQSMMVGRKRNVSSEKVRGIYKSMSSYTATGRRRDGAHAARAGAKKHVRFNVPQDAGQGGAAKKRMAEPKVNLQLMESSSESAAMIGNVNKRRKGRAAAKNADMEASKDAANAKLRAGLAAVCAIALTIAIIALAASAVSASENERDEGIYVEELLRWTSEGFTTTGTMTDRAARFIAFGNAEAYNDIFAVVGTNALNDLTTPPLKNHLVNNELRSAVSAARGPLQSFATRAQVAIAIGAMARASVPAAAPQAAMASWDEEKITAETIARYSSVANVTQPAFKSSSYYREKAAVANDNRTDAATRAALRAELRYTALKVLSSGKTLQDLRQSLDILFSSLHIVEDIIKTWADHGTETIQAYAGGALACACVLALNLVASVAAVLLNARAQQKSQQPKGRVSVKATITAAMKSSPFALVTTVSGSALCVAAIGVLCGALATTADNEALLVELDRYAKFTLGVATDTIHITEFAISGKAHEAYLGLKNRDAATFGMAEFDAFARSSVTVAAMGGDAFRENFQAVLRAQNISVTLGLHGYGLAALAPIRELFNVYPAYNIESEPGYEVDSVTFRDDNPALWYSTLTRDLATHDAATLKRMGEHALLGQRAFRDTRSVFDAFPRGVDAIIDLFDLDGVADQLAGLLTAGIVLAAIVAVLMAALIIQIALGALQTTAEVGGSKDLLGDLFAGTIRRSVAAIMFLAVILAIQLGLLIQYESNAKTATRVTLSAHLRSTHVADTMLVTNRLARVMNADLGSKKLDPVQLKSFHGPFGQAITYQESLCDLVSRLAEARAVVGQSSLGDSAAQVTATLGGAAPTLDRQLVDWTSAVNTLCTMQLAVQPVTRSFNSSAFAGQAAVTLDEYRFTDENLATVNTIAATMRRGVRVLIKRVDASTAVYHDDAKAKVNEPLIPAAVMLVVLVVCAFLEDRLIFNPTGERLAMEEAGARLLLNMIPPAVRSVVPKIRLYLETGVIVQSDAESRAHPMTCESVTEFIANWQAGAPEADSSAILDSSAFGTVIIDGLGTIQHVNKAFMEMFDYERSDVVGENVKMLTEEPIRSIHDGFLKRYVGGGSSRLVGQAPRDVFALTKSGTRRHVMIRLHEASRNNDVFFLGLLQPYDGAAVTEDAGMAAALAAVERE